MKTQHIVRMTLILAIVGLLALTAALPVAAGGGEVLIFGRVRDITNDKGVSGITPMGDPVSSPAIVELVKPNGTVLQSRVVSANGDYLFSVSLMAGVYTLRVASLPANYGAQLVGTRLNPATNYYKGVALAPAFVPGVAQVPVVVMGASKIGWIDFEYTAGALNGECRTPPWSYIHGMLVVADDPLQTPVAGVVFALDHNVGTPSSPVWVPVSRPSDGRVFFNSTDRGIFGVGIRYVPGQYRLVFWSVPVGFLMPPNVLFILNPCGSDNKIPTISLFVD